MYTCGVYEDVLWIVAQAYKHVYVRVELRMVEMVCFGAITARGGLRTCLASPGIVVMEAGNRRLHVLSHLPLTALSERRGLASIAARHAHV